MDMRKTRDLERALEKEKNANLQHHLQLQKARDELGALRAESKDDEIIVFCLVKKVKKKLILLVHLSAS